MLRKLKWLKMPLLQVIDLTIKLKDDQNFIINRNNSLNEWLLVGEWLLFSFLFTYFCRAMGEQKNEKPGVQHVVIKNTELFVSDVMNYTESPRWVIKDLICKKATY